MGLGIAPIFPGMFLRPVNAEVHSKFSTIRGLPGNSQILYNDDLCTVEHNIIDYRKIVNRDYFVAIF